MPTKTNTSPSKDHHGANRGLSDTELQRKRARDRKSQQAMRNRIKWSMDGLTEHVAHLTKALEQETWQNSHCQRRIFALEQENVQLRADNAALQLSLQSDVTGGDHPSALSLNFSDLEKLPSWHTLPLNIPPTCLSDQIFQGCLGAQLQDLQVEKNTNPKPDLTRLIDDSARCGTNANNIILDIVKSYTEIDSLPKQVGVHFVMFRLLRVSPSVPGGLLPFVTKSLCSVDAATRRTELEPNAYMAETRPRATYNRARVLGGQNTMVSA